MWKYSVNSILTIRNKKHNYYKVYVTNLFEGLKSLTQLRNLNIKDDIILKPTYINRNGAFSFEIKEENTGETMEQYLLTQNRFNHDNNI